jgi:hypothetical protein
MQSTIQRYPNGVQSTGIAARCPGAPKGAQTLGKETSEYQQEEKSIEIPLVAASETGLAQTESLHESAGRCSVRPSICDPATSSRSCL